MRGNAPIYTQCTWYMLGTNADTRARVCVCVCVCACVRVCVCVVCVWVCVREREMMRRYLIESKHFQYERDRQKTGERDYTKLFYGFHQSHT